MQNSCVLFPRFDVQTFFSQANSFMRSKTLSGLGNRMNGLLPKEGLKFTARSLAQSPPQNNTDQKL
jgi:hypothetical protein